MEVDRTREMALTDTGRLWDSQLIPTCRHTRNTGLGYHGLSINTYLPPYSQHRSWVPCRIHNNPNTRNLSGHQRRSRQLPSETAALVVERTAAHRSPPPLVPSIALRGGLKPYVARLGADLTEAAGQLLNSAASAACLEASWRGQYGHGIERLTEALQRGIAKKSFVFAVLGDSVGVGRSESDGPG